jgi:hypothetical protein
MYLLAAPFALTLYLCCYRQPTATIRREVKLMWIATILLLALKLFYGVAMADEFDGDWDDDEIAWNCNKRYLSDAERDRIFRELQWTTLKSIQKMEEAKTVLKEVKGSKSVTIVIEAAIESCIVTLPITDLRAKTITICLSIIAKYISSGYTNFKKCYECVIEAKALALKADDLQDQLFYDDGRDDDQDEEVNDA